MELNEHMSEPKKTPGYLKEILQWTEAIVIAVIVALLIRGFVFELVLVQGDSMKDTLHSGERLIVYKLGYYFHPPKRGDIIVLQYQEGEINYIPFINVKCVPILNKIFPAVHEVDYIKRVIGLPGDTVDIKDDSVYINGEKLKEPYAKGVTYKQVLDFPTKVPANKVLVFGDNRQNSSDSRQIGFIDFSRVKGKAVFRLLPLNTFGGVYKNTK